MQVSYQVGRWCAAALLVTPDGRYLMQQRDDTPEILLPGHWGCFGGSVDAGEDCAEAMRRELLEELELEAREVAFYTELAIRLPLPDRPRWDRMSFFVVPVTDAEIARMVLHEGRAKGLFSPEALAAEDRVAPWDLGVVLLHARERKIFPR